jgi:hypothetical protein
MKTRQILLPLAVLAACLTAHQVLAADPIPPERFSELQALIQPDSNELLWRRIPWQTDVWQARKKAAQEGKPLLLWVGMGHPLGVT